MSLPRTVGDFVCRYRPAAVGRPDRLDRHAFARGYEAYPGIAVDDQEKIGGAGAGDEGAAAMHQRRATLAARQRTEKLSALSARPPRGPARKRALTGTRESLRFDPGVPRPKQK